MLGIYVVCPKCEKHDPLSLLSQEERERIKLSGMCARCEKKENNNGKNNNA